jgi:hypothetical protein
MCELMNLLTLPNIYEVTEGVNIKKLSLLWNPESRHDSWNDEKNLIYPVSSDMYRIINSPQHLSGEILT